MRFGRLIALAGCLLAALPLSAQYRDDQFKRDAFTQTYADTTEKSKTDTSQLFSFKEYFGGLGHKRKSSLRNLTIGSAVLVGGTQIYNKQYWKLPIIYGGIGAGIYGGIHFNKLYQNTGDEKYKLYRTLSIAGAGLFYWGSLMDGVVCYDNGGKYPDPAKSTIYSLLLPGLGQLYNGEFWKVPIYWGLMAGSIHFVIDNNTQYKRWKWIYDQATSEDPEVEKPPQSAENAKYYRDAYRRMRDYSILAVAISYLLQVIDANVFAYMQDFEVNDDISMKVAPSVVPIGDYAMARPAVGLSIGLKF
ncbi:MAG: hypothetical protein II454_03490 [Bacteroidales bacterium]|nr:hypothetical protein [Bacteroidales bacterium]